MNRTSRRPDVGPKQSARPLSRPASRDNRWALGLEVRHLRAFVTLVEQRNMTAAAERLAVAQSTISEALTALERALGTRMIARRRGGHSIDLTPAGQALLPHARRVLASLEDAHVAVAAVAADVNGSVELVANESVSTYLLPAALAVVRRNWPNMQFAVTVGMCPSMHEGLSSGRFDVGLMLQVPSCATSNATEPSRVASPRTTRELKQVPLVVFSGAQHPLAARDQSSDIPRDDLAPYPLFVTDGQGYFYDALRRFFRSDALMGPRLHSTGSVEGVKRSVVANPNGLGVLPDYAVAEDLGAGLIRAITIRPTAPSLSLHALLYRARTPMHPAIAELMDVLSTTLGAIDKSQQASSRNGG